MTSRVYQVNNRVAKPRTQSPRSLMHSPSPSVCNSTISTDSARTVAGQSSVEEVRQRQILRYTEDKMKYQLKEKEKAEKKREEKFKRYSHIDLGQRLQNPDENRNDIKLVRQKQQAHNDVLAPNALRLKQEKEEMKAKRNEIEKEAKLKKYSQITCGQQLMQRSNSISSPSTSSDQNSSSSPSVNQNKEEEFRKQMRANRERLQHLYNEKMNKDN